MTNNNQMIYQANEKPPKLQWLILSIQHVFAMFGATILVPLLTGLDVGVALITSGIGTLIYIICTKAKVPMYLGSSFAYIAAVSTAIISGGLGSALLGIIFVGIIYVLVALVIKFAGTNWLHKLLPPVVIGPMIIIIGLGLAPTAINSIGLNGDTGYTPNELKDVKFGTDDFYDVSENGTFYFIDYNETSGEISGIKTFSLEDGNYTTPTDFNVVGKFFAYQSNPANSNKEVSTVLYYANDSGVINEFKSNSHLLIPLVALITFMSVILISLLAKGFMKVIPFIIAILIGYITASLTGLVDWSVFNSASFFQLPNFSFAWLDSPDLLVALTFIPLAFVTISEHIGDHVVLGEIMNQDFLQDPGLEKTLLGDGIATLVAGALGGPANTSYGENTSVVGLTKVASVWVTGLAAIIAILLGFFGYIQAFIASIPWAVIGGITVVLYGFIAGNGVKVLIKDRTDLGDTRNLIIVSTMLVLGLGGAIISFNAVAGLSGMALAAVFGILLNLFLPKEKKVSEETPAK